MAGKYYHDKEDPSTGKKALWGIGEMLMVGGGIALLSFVVADVKSILTKGEVYIDLVIYSILLTMVLLGLVLFLAGWFRKKTTEQLAEEAVLETQMTPEEKEARKKQRKKDKLYGDLFGLASILFAVLFFWLAPNAPEIIKRFCILPSVWGIGGVVCNRTSIIAWLASINSVAFIVLLFAMYL